MSENRPNVIVVLTDDQGCWAMGCAGNAEIRTPNLDRLAATGVRFENFFCASPVCSPARASLMTGRIPSQHGVHDWLRGGNMADDGDGAGRAIEYLRGMTGYSDVLAANGYVCGFSGKWHMGDSIRPQKGFSHWYAHAYGGGPYYGAPMIRDGEKYTEDKYVSDAITDDALEFIDSQNGASGPFYLSVHYTAPHSPWIDSHPEEIVALYDDCPFESCPDVATHPWQLGTAPRGEGDKRRRILAGYFAAVTAMDANVGRILDKLEADALRENTLVFFTSDNGMNMGHHGIYGKGNGTFPQNMYDTSVKVPAIISQPGSVPAGRVEGGLLSHYDFMPTLLDYLGMAHREADDLPGRSFAPLLRGQEMAGRENVVVYDEYGPVRMIRDAEWKYVHRCPYGPHELYHLAEDPNEETNLVDGDEHGERVESMRAGLAEFFLRYVDPSLDGTREPVYGSGQIGLVGPAGRGARAFCKKQPWIGGDGTSRDEDYCPIRYRDGDLK